MALKKIVLKPGVNRENTRYTTEGGWYDCDKIRFRQGTPEKIGGWQPLSTYTFLGICRSLWSWVTLDNLKLIGVGTNIKFYIERGGQYFDITPLRDTVVLTDPFQTFIGSPSVTVTDPNGGFLDGDFVTFSGASSVGGLTINGEYEITYLSPTTYSITASSNATSNAVGGGTVTAAYQINTGPAIQVPVVGWGNGVWGSGTWGFSVSTSGTLDSLRLWSQANFGEDLIFGPRGGGLYYWDSSSGVTIRGVAVQDIPGASNVPSRQNITLVSDISRFVFCMGTNDFGSATFDPMLVRWSDQEDFLNWTPTATTQSGSLRLSNGSRIVAAIQSRQEVLVWTDAAVYSLQYVGPPVVWQAQLIGENISIVGQNAVAYSNGVAFWMGVDKFYKYDGRTQTLRCDLRQFIYTDLNLDQSEQIFAGTNEGFNEVWWFYCTKDSTEVNRYVVYNYAEDIWYYGSLGRTAWLDSAINVYPVAATYDNTVVFHELGNDDITLVTVNPINSYITSSEFDLEDGDKFAFIWRMLPDITFRNSTTASPTGTLYLLPLANSGSGYYNPPSVGGSNNAAVTRTQVIPIEEFTGQVYTRVRGRQMALKFESTALGVAWQLGAPRIDIRPDGRR
jgi:hypothetical protein